MLTFAKQSRTDLLKRKTANWQYPMLHAPNTHYPNFGLRILVGGTQGRLRAKVVPKYHLADPWLFVSMNCLADRTSHLYPVRVYYFNTDQFFLLKETGSGRCWQKIALNSFRWCWNEAVWGTVIVVKIFKSKFQSAFQTSDKAKKKCFLFTTLNQLH